LVSELCAAFLSARRSSPRIKRKRRWHWVILAIAVVVATVTAAVLLALRTMPPRSIAMATGPEGGAYYEIGKRYQAILSHSGVQLRLVSTNGALQNLALLRDPHSGVSGGTPVGRDHY
jgi:hypothetical protein